MQIGVTFDRQQALEGSVDKREVADGGTFVVPVSYLPASGRPSYIVIEDVADSGATSASLSLSDFSVVAVYVNGDYRGTATDPACSGGDALRFVLEATDDGSETSVSDVVSLGFPLGEV